MANPDADGPAVTIEDGSRTVEFIDADGKTTTVIYDVVEWKMHIDGLLAKHQQVNAECLAEFIEFLQAKGVPNPTETAAYRLLNLITVQFAQICSDITQQINTQA